MMNMSEASTLALFPSHKPSTFHIQQHVDHVDYSRYLAFF